MSPVQSAVDGVSAKASWRGDVGNDPDVIADVLMFSTGT
jgi:hypothetical protein